jgi:hypothetical protein
MADLTSKFLHTLRQRQEELAKSILSSPVADFPMYKQVVGEYNGIQFAIDALMETIRGDEDNG